MSFHWIAAALLSFGLAYLKLTSEIELDPWSALDAVNSRTLPQLYGLMLCLAVIALWIQRWRKSTSQRDPETVKPSPLSSFQIKPLLMLTGLIGSFVFALLWLNLWVATAGLLFALLWVMQERRWQVLAGLSLGLPITGFVLVERLLQMSVPIS